MGGFTKIQLKDTSQENIDTQNAILDKMKLRKNMRFYSEKDIELEYEYYLKRDGNYPEHLFPEGKINSYEDFRKYWSTEALGESFVPPVGALTFDCYFGRTSKRAMNILARYIRENMDLIKETSGSYSTFVERSGYKKKSQELLLELD